MTGILSAFESNDENLFIFIVYLWYMYKNNNTYQ
jgi:hypothetical protein